MEQTSDEIDEMFSNLLGEMDMLTQSLEVETFQLSSPKESTKEFNFSVGFKDLNESLSTLEDKDLDALMADLVADINEAEQKTLQAQKTTSDHEQKKATESLMGFETIASYEYKPSTHGITTSGPVEDVLPPPPLESELDFPLPPPPPPAPEPLTQEQQEAQAKTDKIKLALEKLKEAKVKKLVVKVHMNDNSTKSLMVDERQVARDVLDNLFEKTHCDCKVDWCLYEVYPELQIERFFEDHENVVEVLSDWTRDSENKMLFLEKNEKYAVFKNPQNFYLANKGKNESKEMNEKNKEALLEESFCGASVIVPELEAALYLKEDGKKSWKRRYFLLRASGIYYVPKGKTKTSRDLACFIQFENVNIYYGTQYRVKYKAPTDHCFVLKHPQIQKESQYIKYLCCDDQWTLHQWVTGIRIAKYGKTLYDNYKRAVQRAGLAARWTSLGIVEPAVSTGSSSTGAAQANGQIHHTVPPASKEFSEAPKQAEIAKEKRPNVVNNSSSAQPVIRPQKPQAKQALQPPPPPQRRSSATVSSPCLPSKAKRGSTASLSDPISFPAPPPDMGSDLPPPPPDFYEPPPDFVPPPPPSFSNSTGDLAPPLPPPPPPPPASVTSKPLPLTRKPGPPAPKRQENTGQVGETKSTGVEGGQLDFMSDLRKALNKKRGDNTS
ncbi:amyloid beta A4 precursor protein-binding family B member 1-interacting protein isoform X1 [Alligator sinensis]|uniref:Amyloid beta A4 precursor protein-binding family B member 1-interacting protein n=1 Tax=Alligator sinensis TaxID=38654 RepID=A0A1U7S4G5_ALLSI|nr:amyloid beta A4 precursor protein-binding family B member 1-interacting protein isoform X1 [Alligator sinensis]XP_006025423.1 amyloid beta A4 precursor protein-binding family B member 1-interacting protein isoform X1 [Alligator sinensis]